MKFDPKLVYMECFCISVRGRGPSLGGLVCIETILMVFFWKIEVYSPETFSLCPFWALFGPNLDLFGSNISLKLVCDLGLDLSIVTVYIF